MAYTSHPQRMTPSHRHVTLISAAYDLSRILQSGNALFHFFDMGSLGGKNLVLLSAVNVRVYLLEDIQV